MPDTRHLLLSTGSFNLAPGGVYSASFIAKTAGVSYTSFSPLLAYDSGLCIFCCTFHLFAKKFQLLAGTLYLGVRTFLSFIFYL